jgi:hypothetical protein
VLRKGSTQKWKHWGKKAQKIAEPEEKGSTGKAAYNIDSTFSPCCLFGLGTHKQPCCLTQVSLACTPFELITWRGLAPRKAAAAIAAVSGWSAEAMALRDAAEACAVQQAV